ncbi:MAG TPA: hypothetical protein VJG32_16700 [Anaerolineae bacterium]|nr:hypothetical protein [Anaerolineae bacterium]
MSILPLLPILLLLAGALAILLGRVARFNRSDTIASIASALALLAMLLMATPGRPASETLVSAWQPLSVFGTPVSLRVDPAGWLIGFVAVAACAATALAGIAYPGRQRFASRVLALGMTAALVFAVFSANLLTLALAWGLFDALFAIAVLARSEGAQVDRRTAFAVGFNGAATVCLWLAALALNQAHQSQYWHLAELSDSARDFLALAALLRLGLYPLSQSLPEERDDAPGRVALLYVLPPLAGLHLLVRLADLDALPANSVLIAPAALSILIGGALAWWRGRSREALPYLALSSIGAVVLSGLSSRPTSAPPAVLANGAAAWAMAIMTLSFGRGFDRHRPWWSVGYALAFATLVGIPASLGFVVQTSLASGLADASLLLIAMILIGEALTFAALIRLATTPAPNKAPGTRAAIAAYAGAIALTALLPFLLPALGRSIIPTLAPPSFEVALSSLGLLGGVLFALPSVLAGALEWVTHDWPAAPHADPARWLSLGWLYDLILRMIGGLAGALRGLARVLEGEGAVLWALLILIAAYVILSGSIQ